MVISITNVTPTHGSRYYAQEGNINEAAQSSGWNGKLAVPLGLKPGQPIQSESLGLLLYGKDLNRCTLISKMRVHQKQQNATAKGQLASLERAGIDLTASAPKSVSIQALIFGDRSLEVAHQQAIAQMLEILEERYAMTRITVNGERQKIITGKLLIAQFQHTTSRALDPQLHTHNLILNLTQRPDGKWQCLDNEAIYRTKMLLGMIYRNELAREVQALGYSICITQPRHGLWELEGFSTQQLTQFSKRAEQIKEVAGEGASSERKAKATIFSGRAKKQTVPSDQLAESWQQQAKATGLQAITPGEPQIHPLKRLWAIAQELVHQAIAFCSRIANFFRREDLEKVAMQEGLGQTSFAAIAKAIDQSPELMSFRDKKQRLRYTTKGDSFDDGLQDSAPEQTPINLLSTHRRESTIGNDRQSAQTPLRRLFAALHLQSNRQAIARNNKSEAGDVDCGESRDPRANQAIDETASAITQGHDDAVPAVDGNALRTDDFLEQPGFESATFDQAHAQLGTTANSDRGDAALNSADESAATQFQPNSVDDWEPSL